MRSEQENAAKLWTVINDGDILIKKCLIPIQRVVPESVYFFNSIFHNFFLCITREFVFLTISLWKS